MMKRLATLVLFAALCVSPVFAQAPAPAPAPQAAQDGFVPVDAPISPQDTIPAPRLVAIAYGFIWIVIFGYVWSVRSRLTRVEREMETLSRRVAAGSTGSR